ncbi:NAD-dependent epimerase/dehydratase family protein [Microbacterium sediminicola]|uniref:NAD-dependent epimerase/dehydratase family protein n=1 Tax=Microbacterium sediminicola TaxID=415210 RepID=A0ABP4TJD4_9MICO
MKALVTGAAGFIGSTLMERLSAEGDSPVGIDNFSDYYDPEIKRSNAAFVEACGGAIIDGDVNEIDLDALLEDVDVVYHLAGQPGVRKSWGSAFDVYVTANVSATQRLLEAARRVPTRPRVVYASSSSVYGNAESYPTSEVALPQPRSPYGVTKLAGEHLCRLYAANHGVSTVSLRFFTVYGPRQRPDMAFTRFLSAALRDEPIHVFGTGDQIRDFTYVADIVESIIRAGTADVAKGSVYNVSGGGSHSVNEVLAVIEDLTGRAVQVQREDAALGDVSRTTAEITAITSALAWNPSTDLRTGLAAQLEWLRSMGTATSDWS